MSRVATVGHRALADPGRHPAGLVDLTDLRPTANAAAGRSDLGRCARQGVGQLSGAALPQSTAASEGRAGLFPSSRASAWIGHNGHRTKDNNSNRSKRDRRGPPRTTSVGQLKAQDHDPPQYARKIQLPHHWVLLPPSVFRESHSIILSVAPVASDEPEGVLTPDQHALVHRR
jgi:hypothetical protein